MKRIICLLLVILMVGTLLVACGDDTPADPNSGNTTNNGGDNNQNPDQDPPSTDDPTVQDPPNTEDPPTPPPTVEPETEWYEDVKFKKGTSITIQLSEVEDKELACGHKRYMQGPEKAIDGDGGFEKVQNEVLKRNEAAKKELGLDVNYVYITEDWSHITGKIIATEKLGPGYTPDMYSDQMYDMVGLSYQHGMFTNILRYTQTNKQNVEGWKEGNGYFNITKSNGYNADLMKDFALSTDKQFLIASDYFVDVMRAMVVMPFNLKMYEGYATLEDGSPDTGAKGLYQIVKDGNWTWAQLLSYKGVYEGTGKATVNDTKMLMALSTGGLSATGIVYSTAFENFTVSNGVYTLDKINLEVVKSFQNAADLATDISVACGDESLQGQPAGVEKSKEIFTSDRALFSGPMMLGVVEETDFAAMEKLSIVPVPKNTGKSKHNTTINSRARVGAVSYNSQKKTEISAWIQYCTEKSDVVKKEYFDKAMNSKYLAGSGASEMLDLIYKNVGSNKSYVLDNMIQHKKWEMQNYVWSHMIQQGNFTTHRGDINGVYETAVEAKQAVLNEILADWAKADAISAQ